MSIWKYPEMGDIGPEVRRVTLGEGGTPLIRSVRIGPELGLRNLWFKCEGANPTGSYKDRFAAAAVTHLHYEGKRVCLGTSSGNAGSAMAAYCAHAGIVCHLAIVEGAPEGKLRQMRAYGAHLFRIRNFGVSPTSTAEVMHGLKRLAAELDAGFEITAFVFSPRGMAGVQTIGYEIVEAFPREAFSIFSPAGGGGLTLAVARGVEQRGARGRVHCVQPVGNDTMASPLRSGANEGQRVESKTVISGLQVGGVLDANDVIATCRRLGGQGYAVEDESIFRWQQRMAREEGVFSEPAGAVALAGVEQAVSRGEVAANENVICLVTGSGFKDERALARMAGETETPLLENFAEFSSRVRGG